MEELCLSHSVCPLQMCILHSFSGSADQEGLRSRGNRKLRSAPAAVKLYTFPEPREIEPKEDPRMQQLIRLAAELGYQLTPHKALATELVRSVSRRLVPRIGDRVYQTASYTLEGFSLATMNAIFPIGKVDGMTQWLIESTADLRMILGEGMASLSNLSAGVSRGQKTASESVIRVLATLIPPFRAIWWSTSGGLSRVQINFMYVLVQGTGEVHPPKDDQRRELLLSEQINKEARIAALTDARLLAEQGHPLSPEWWLQLGDKTKSQEMTARLLAQQGDPSSGKRKSRTTTTTTWEVESIVAERRRNHGREFLVRWLGYHPSWEAWRMPDWDGAVGDPVETWEPHKLLRTTAALEDWEEQKRREQVEKEG